MPVEMIEVHFDVESPMEVADVVLTLSSPVFRAMLDHRMREARCKSISLPGKSRSEFEVFLLFLDPATSHSQRVTMANVDLVTRWSDEYQVLGLRARCEEFLRGLEITLENVDFITCWSDAYNVPELRQKCEEFLKAQKITGESVDSILHWCCKHQDAALRKSCEESLLRFPVDSERLLQAHNLNLAAQRQRCIEEVGRDFEDYDIKKVLLEAPELIEELLPFMQDGKRQQKMTTLSLLMSLRLTLATRTMSREADFRNWAMEAVDDVIKVLQA